MKRKPRSIRFKFFAAISAVALVFIGVLLLLNVFFFSDYYMMMRRSELRDAYRSIRSSYDRNADGIATILDNYESQTAIRLAVIRADGTVLYTSFWSMDEETQDPFQLPDLDLFEQQRRGYTILQAIAQNIDLNALRSRACRSGTTTSICVWPARWMTTRTNACSPICPTPISSRTPRST